MRNLGTWALAAVVTLLLLGIHAAQSQSPSIDLTAYEFALDETADHRVEGNYSVAGGGTPLAHCAYRLTHPFKLQIERQEGDGKFTGRITQTAGNATYTVTGQVSRSALAASGGGSIKWSYRSGGILEGTRSYQGAVILDTSGRAFIAGWSQVMGTSQVHGPVPFCGDGLKQQGPPH